MKPSRRPAIASRGGYWHGLGRGPAVAQPPPDYQYRGRARRRGERGQSLLEFYGLPQPGGDRAGLLRRCPARRPATNRRRVEDRRSQSDPRPERLAGQERQHLLLSFQAAQIRWLFLILATGSSARRRRPKPVRDRSPAVSNDMAGVARSGKRRLTG